jgi:hypothetical protein
MKLRFHDNSLRLRLSQSEVARLKQEGRIEERIAFGPHQTLTYSIEAAPVTQVGASFADGSVRVVAPRAIVHAWVDSDQVGIESAGSTPRVLIEKDFKCVHPSSEDADSFPNPLAHN